MRTSVIEINGEKHLLCFNLYAVKECSERYGSIVGINDAVHAGAEGKRIEECLWLLSTLMRAGEMYAKESGISDNPKALSVEQMLAVCDVGFFKGLGGRVIHAINDGMSVNVEVEDSKKEETTQES